MIVPESTAEKNQMDEQNRNFAFEIMCNMIYSEKQRHKLAKEDKLSMVFEQMASQKLTESTAKSDLRILEKLSQLVTLISYHQDMFDHIIKLNLLTFVIKISNKKFPSTIRSNAVLAISMLTYNEKLFEEIIDKGVIDLIMELCRD